MSKIAAIILVGGEATRLQGRNKCDLKIGPKTCLEWTLALFKDQVHAIALSVGTQDRYNHATSHPIIIDWPSPTQNSAVAYAILGSLSWAHQTGYDAIITTPVDTPLLPKSYAADLKQHATHHAPTVCKTPDGLQGLHAIWPTSCLEQLKTSILEDNIFKVSKLHSVLNSRELIIKTEDTDRFLNINNEALFKVAQNTYSEQSTE